MNDNSHYQDNSQSGDDAHTQGVTIFSSSSEERTATQPTSQDDPRQSSDQSFSQSNVQGSDFSSEHITPEAIAAATAYEENRRVENEIAKKSEMRTAPTPTDQDVAQPSQVAEDQSQKAMLNQPLEPGIPITSIKIRPSVTLLIFRLLGLGLVLLGLLFVLALLVDLLRFAFGNDVLSVLNSRTFTYTLGLLLYMAIGFVFYQQWENTIYTLTPDVMVFDKGWLFKNRQTRDISQFGGVRVTQSFLGKMLNYGDLRLEYHGAIGKVAGETMRNIPDPFWHEDMLYKMITPTR